MAKGKNYSKNYFNNKNKKEGAWVIQTTENNQNPIYAYGKGECYEFAKGHSEGQIFDITDCGARLHVFWENPTSREREQFKAEQPLEIKTIEINDALFMLFKFGDLPWFETPYNVHLSPNWNDIPSSATGNSGFALTIHLYDTRDGKLLHNRLYTIPHDISVQILEAVKHQQETKFHEAQYDQHLKETYAKYTTDQLVEMASAPNSLESTSEILENENLQSNNETIENNANQTLDFANIQEAIALGAFLKILPYGCRFEMTNTGAILQVLAIEPGEKEIKQLFSAEKVLVKTLEIENVVYLLFKFGDVPWCIAPYNAYYDTLINVNRSSDDNVKLNLLVELYDMYSDKSVTSKQITLDADTSTKILKIINHQLEEPFDVEQYINTLKAIPASYMPEHLVMFAESKSRFDSINELEQEWQSKYADVNKPIFYNLDRTMSRQTATDMLEVAALLEGSFDNECAFLFHKSWYHYKAGKLYANYILVPNTVNRGISTVLKEIGSRYQD